MCRDYIKKYWKTSERYFQKEGWLRKKRWRPFLSTLGSPTRTRRGTAGRIMLTSTAARRSRWTNGRCLKLLILHFVLRWLHCKWWWKLLAGWGVRALLVLPEELQDYLPFSLDWEVGRAEGKSEFFCDIFIFETFFLSGRLPSQHLEPHRCVSVVHFKEIKENPWKAVAKLHGVRNRSPVVFTWAWWSSWDPWCPCKC